MAAGKGIYRIRFARSPRLEMKMEIYLDNAATTRCSSAAEEALVEALIARYGNPSSAHGKGVDAERIVREATEKIAKTLHAKGSEIIHTSGGTESNNLAIIGAARARARSGRHIIAGSTEHPSVLNTVKSLEREGFEVSYIPVDREGVIDLRKLKSLIRDDTVLVTLMAVNNEVGSKQPIGEAGSAIKSINPYTIFHVDAVQAYGKEEIHPAKLMIDLLSASAHKIHGPKGAGFLYIREGTRILPLFCGGGQQRGLRPGTLNTPGIAGMAAAASEAYGKIEKTREKLVRVRLLMCKRLSSIEGVVLHGGDGERIASHIVSAAFTGVKSEVLLHALEEEGIYVSAGSACTSHRRTPSNTLTQMGIKREWADSTLRLSFCPENTEEEVQIVCDTIEKLLPVLRRYTRR